MSRCVRSSERPARCRRRPTRLFTSEQRAYDADSYAGRVSVTQHCPPTSDELLRDSWTLPFPIIVRCHQVAGAPFLDDGCARRKKRCDE